MEQNISKIIDDQGRVFLPQKLMKLLGWGSGDELVFSNTHRAIVLSLARRHKGPRCVVCSKLGQQVEICIGGSDICSGCLQAIVNTGAAIRIWTQERAEV